MGEYIYNNDKITKKCIERTLQRKYRTSTVKIIIKKMIKDWNKQRYLQCEDFIS